MKTRRTLLKTLIILLLVTFTYDFAEAKYSQSISNITKNVNSTNCNFWINKAAVDLEYFKEVYPFTPQTITE
jgi:hypothetical protein